MGCILIFLSELFFTLPLHTGSGRIPGQIHILEDITMVGASGRDASDLPTSDLSPECSQTMVLDVMLPGNRLEETAESLDLLDIEISSSTYCHQCGCVLFQSQATFQRETLYAENMLTNKAHVFCKVA